jgi:hypothetical protein
MAAPEGHFLEAVIHAVDSLTLRDCYKKQVFYDELFERKLESKRLFNASNSWSDVTPSEAPVFSFLCGMGPYFPVIRSAFNTLRLDADNMQAPFSLIVRYTIIPREQRHQLDVTWLSSSYGYVTSPGYNGLNYGPGVRLSAWCTIEAPADMENVMLSFQCPNHLPFLNTSEFAGDDINVTVEDPWGVWPVIMPNIHDIITEPIIVTSVTRVYVQYSSLPGVLTRGFIMRFSFHPYSPEKLPNGTWDCSQWHYATWSLHVNCNLVKECSDGRDEEGPCPYSGAGCGPGMVASTNKCFFALTNSDVSPYWDDSLPARFSDDIPKTFNQTKAFKQGCHSRGGSFGVVQSEQDEVAVRTLLSFASTGGMCKWWKTGVKYRNVELPNTYRKMRSTYDRDILYRSTPHEALIDAARRLRDTSISFPHHISLIETFLQKIRKDYPLVLHSICSQINLYDFFNSPSALDCITYFCGVICQTRTFSPTALPAIQRSRGAGLYDVGSVLTLQKKAPLYLACPKAHLTHAFLSCHTDNDCFTRQQVSACPDPGQTAVTSSVSPRDSLMDADTEASTTPTNTTLFPTFQYGDSGERIHFTQVCDFGTTAGTNRTSRSASIPRVPS